MHVDNVGVNALYKDDEWKKFQAVGKFGEKNLKLDYLPRGDGSYSIYAEADDAGQALRALRLYDKVRDGILRIDGVYSEDEVMRGIIKIRGLKLTKPPVLAKLLTVASLSGIIDLFSGDGMKFDRLDLPFEYKKGLVKINNGLANGSVLGLTFSGEIDRNTDNINIKGVIAPAYGINSFIGSIPILGDLLKGRDRTVFGANYSIKGNIDDPKVSVNPFSALSPNSVKELFNGENN